MVVPQTILYALEQRHSRQAVPLPSGSAPAAPNKAKTQPALRGWIGDRGMEERREWKYRTWEIKGT